MILSIKNGGYAFLIRLDLMFSMSLCRYVSQEKKIAFSSRIVCLAQQL